jgi:hypothetical protein
MTKINNADHPMLRELAPGDRVLVSGGLAASPVAAQRSGGGRSSNGPRNRRGGSPSTQNGSARREGQPARSGARGSGSGRGRGAGRPAVNRNSSGSTGGHSAATFSRRSRSY